MKGALMLCDKCGQVVPRDNDAVRIHMTAHPEAAPYLVLALPRHFLPTQDCPGSPSRAQYIDGQPRDDRYPYDESEEQRWRDAFAQIKAEG